MNHLAAAIDALKSGNLSGFSELLAEEPALVDARIEGGMSLLALACFFGRLDAVQLMRSHGRKLDVFEAAALGDDAELARLLDEDSAAINRYSSYGFTPLHHAAYMAGISTVRLLVDRGADVNCVSREHMQLTPLHQSASKGKGDIVSLLLEHGANPTPPHPQGYSPLHAAAAGGNLAPVRRLLTLGADPFAKYQGKTPADIAAEHGHNDVAAAIRAEMP